MDAEAVRLQMDLDHVLDRAAPKNGPGSRRAESAQDLRAVPGGGLVERRRNEPVRVLTAQ